MESTTIDKETREKIDLMFERFSRMEQTVEALGRILIRRRTAEQSGVIGRTIDRNENVKKFDEIGHERTFIEIGDVAVIKRAPKKKRARKR